MERERFEKVIDDITKELNELKNISMCDYSDIGNTIGIIIEKNKTEEDDRYVFEMGLRHGYSLVDGTH